MGEEADATGPQLGSPKIPDTPRPGPKETDKIDATREPKQHEINERYRHWKCVPADAVYQAPK